MCDVPLGAKWSRSAPVSERANYEFNRIAVF